MFFKRKAKKITPQTSDEIWTGILAMAQKITDQRALIANLEEGLASNPPQIKTNDWAFPITDGLAGEIAQAMLSVANSQLALQQTLKSQAVQDLREISAR
jgi:hypothetical protein